MTKIIVFIPFFICSFISISQNKHCDNKLTGKIIDEHDKTPLEFSVLLIIELNKSTISNENGEYVFENICDGKYTIKVNHVGCNPIVADVTISGDTKQNFYPEHHAELLKDIEVRARKPEDKTSRPKNNISGRQLDESKGKSLGETLKNIVGVTSIETGNSISKPVIHGLHSNRILILNNGVRQEGQQWGSEHAPEIDPFIANKLIVIKGANAVRYGSDAIAGVILVEPKALIDSAGIDGELNLVGFSNNRQGVVSLMVEQNLKKISNLAWRLQGTLKQAGNSQTPNYWLNNTAFKEYNFSYALGWNKQNYGAEIFYSQFNTTLGIFSGSHIGNLTDLQAVFNQTEPLEKGSFHYSIDRPYQHVEHELFKIKSFVNTGNFGKLNFVYARQYNLRYEYDKHRPRNDALAAFNRPELQYEITTHTTDIIWEHKPINRLHGSIGLNGITQANTYEGRLFIPNYRNYSSGIFWIERLKLNKFEIEGGLRYDYKLLKVFKYENALQIKPIRTFDNVSLNVGMIYKINSLLNFKFNSGKAWRAPAVNELHSNGLHHGAAAIEIGDKNLLPEKAYNSIATLTYNDEKRINAELSVYYNQINDFIYLQPVFPPTLTIRGAFPTFHYKQVDAVIKGIDAMAIHQLTKQVSLTSKASFLRAFNRKINDHLILMPSDRFENTLSYEFKNKNKISDLYVSASTLYVTKQWRVPFGSDFAPPPNAYLLFNFDAGFSFQITKQTFQLGFSGNNLLNEVYRDYLNRFRYYADAIGRNFTVRLKILFNAINNKSKTINNQ